MYWWIAGSLSLIIFSALVTHTVGQYGIQCKLPNQEVGLCMPEKSCKSIYEKSLNTYENGGGISDENQSSLSLLHCGTFKNEPHVCCAESDIQLNPDGLAILKKQSCGVYTIDKVSNGREAALSGFPWMVVLIYNTSDNPYKCGGSLISEQYVLTAAHCLTGKNVLDHVRLGEHRLSTERDCTGGGNKCAPPAENIDVEQIILHENYIKFTDDIALIRLKRKVQYKEHIQPLCLPIYDNLRPKTLKKYVISGWGQTEKELHSDVLMVAVVPHLKRPECKIALKQFNITIELTEAIICAGNSNFTDTCVGDSGGPMGYKANYNGPPRFVQYGVVSVGVNFCGDGNAPNLYSNVSYYMQWITDNMRN